MTNGQALDPRLSLDGFHDLIADILMIQHDSRFRFIGKSRIFVIETKLDRIIILLDAESIAAAPGAVGEGLRVRLHLRNLIQLEQQRVVCSVCR